MRIVEFREPGAAGNRDEAAGGVIAEAARLLDASFSIAVSYADLVESQADVVVIIDGRCPRLTDAFTICLLPNGPGPLFGQRRCFENMLGCDRAIGNDAMTQTLLADLSVALRRPLHAQAGLDRPLAARLAELASRPPPAPPPLADLPLVSVVMRCGGRPVETLRRAVESVARQTHRRMEIVFVRYQHIDVAPALPAGPSSLAATQVIDVAPGMRSTALRAGLQAARGAYVTMLDDDDWWLAHHIQWLMGGRTAENSERYVGYGGTFTVPLDAAGRPEPQAHNFGIRPGYDWLLRAGSMALHALVAAAPLVARFKAEIVDLHMSDDTLVQMQLLAAAEPWFSHAATTFVDRGQPVHSLDWEHPEASVVEETVFTTLRIAARCGPRLPRAEPGPDWWSELRRVWLAMRDRTWIRGLPAAEQPVALSDFSAAAPRAEGRAAILAQGIIEEGSVIPPPSRLLDAATGTLEAQGSGPEFSHIAYLQLPQVAAGHGRCFATFDVSVARGQLGFWLWDIAETSVLSRLAVSADDGPMRVRLPLPDDSATGRLLVLEAAREGEGGSRGEIRGMRICCDRGGA